MRTHGCRVERGGFMKFFNTTKNAIAGSFSQLKTTVYYTGFSCCDIIEIVSREEIQSSYLALLSE